MPFFTGASRGPGSGARADIPGRGSLFQLQADPSLIAANLALSTVGIAGHGCGRPGVARGRLVGRELTHAMSDVDRLLPVVALTDDVVEPGNRVVLAASARDEHGAVPRVELARIPSRRTTANREHVVAWAARLLRAAGAERVYRPGQPPLLFHIHSTLRMGEHARDSVLRPDGEARAVGRLFVADNSALANALGGPNPTLPTQALATRAAEHLFRRVFGGDPWVRGEAPLSSHDPLVTRAVLRAGL
jgi:choline dehydrogenase-like flavoprotein